MHLSISFSAGGDKAHVTRVLQGQRDTAVAATPAAQQLADAALASIDADLVAVADDATVSVSVSLYLGVAVTPATSAT